jgi:hypothetical protein
MPTMWAGESAEPAFRQISAITSRSSGDWSSTTRETRSGTDTAERRRSPVELVMEPVEPSITPAGLE